VKTLNITEKTGKLVSILNVTDDDHIMIINKSGIAIRTEVDQLRVMGRATQGVRIIKLGEKDTIAAIAKIANGKIIAQMQEEKDRLEEEVNAANAAAAAAEGDVDATNETDAAEENTAEDTPETTD
jgi:DNA gyrase subunit A